MSVKIIGPRDKTNGEYINTTSRSNNWSKGLSPFYLGPVNLYGTYTAMNVENAWQAAKVYEKHIGENDEILPEYWEWAVRNWNDFVAHRYPMGRDSKPKFSLWDGKRLSYIEARKQIYIPLYSKAVQETTAFKTLQQLYQEKGEVTLWDFDGYDHVRLGRTLKEVVNDPKRKMGHAFVLAMLLTNSLEEAISD